jgi:uncharacterized protein YjbI with pentapeptide repeats
MLSQANPFDKEEFFQGEAFQDIENEGLKLQGREFEDCLFRTCRFPAATWRRLTFLDCHFEGCDLSNVALRGTRLQGCHFLRCKLIGVDWTETSALEMIRFEDCRLDYGNFSYLDLSHAALVDCSAREIHLAGTNLSHGDCSGTSFLGSTFSGTNLSQTDLRGARDYAVDPRANTLNKTRVALPEAVSLLRGLDILLEE